MLPSHYGRGASSRCAAPPAGRCVATLRSHSDYVTCMAASPAAGLLASGGLQGEVLLWDIGALRQVLASQVRRALSAAATRRRGGLQVVRLPVFGCAQWAIRQLGAPLL